MRLTIVISRWKPKAADQGVDPLLVEELRDNV